MSGADSEYNVHAAAQVETVETELRIAPQPLDRALQEFSQQTGIQVIFFSNLTDGLQSAGVIGQYTVSSALKALLAGTGLSFRVINARTVEIRMADAAGQGRGEQ